MSFKTEIFKTEKPIIGMVHLLALPGTPNFNGDINEIYKKAISEAKALEEGGANGIMVENDGDMPFSINLEIEQTAALAALTAVVKEHVNIPVGVDAAFSDYKSALACAKAARADFVRIPVFIDTVVSFSGTMHPCADQALRYRKKINAEEIMILADIQVKYTNLLVPNTPIEQSASFAEISGADAIIVTGTHTGGETPIETVKKVKDVVKIPVFIGSGTKKENAKEQLDIADGAIVGSSLKTDGKIDVKKVKEFMGQMN